MAKNEARHRFFQSWGPVEFFTVVIAVATCVQAWAFMQSERAFVFPASVDFTDPLIFPMPGLVFQLDIKNSGRSPGSRNFSL
jgi:hypothetical protein